jgi:erythromycin esterase-like protein
MKNITILLIALFIFEFSFSQTITTISKENYKNASFENLDFLKDDLANIKFVGLGETLHFMGETYTAKIKMVKFLHEKCGFDFLAFESPMYNLDILNRQLKERTANSDSIARNISGVWNTTEMTELFTYIVSTQKTQNPLELVGFDESFFSVNKNYDLPKDFSKFIENLEEISKRDFKLDTVFYNAITETANKTYGFSKREPSDTLLMYNKFKDINLALESISYKEDNYLNFWKHMVDNLQSVYRKNYGSANRDKQMAINAEFLGNDLFPNKKIILWAATSHLLYNTESIKAYKESDKFIQDKMGTYLRDKFNQQYFLIAFTPFSGKSGFKGYLGIAKTKVKSKKGSLEHYINETYNADYAYIAFRNKKINQDFTENIVKSNIIWMKGLWYNGEEMDINHVADGIFYIRKEHVVNAEK